MQSDSNQAGHSNCLDFDLEIGLGSGREYPVAVVRSPAGEAHAVMQFPFGELELENRLKDLQIALLRSGGPRRRLLSSEEQSVQEFGQSLFDAVFTSDVRGLYYESQREAELQGKGLRLKLRIRPPELATLPWEFLYDPREAEYVCLCRNTPMVRYLELRRPIQPLTVESPLSILGMFASPRDQEPLNVEGEKQRVEVAIKALEADGLVNLIWLPGQTWRDLQRAMRRGKWHIFHFIGHGGFDHSTDEGIIVLADEQDRTYRLSATQLSRLLADHRSLRLVLLNSCEGAQGSERDIFSSASAILVRRGIPAVLAMQYEITDRAAIEFVRAFYETLADGMPVDVAVVEARKAVSIAVNNTIEWGTPVLHMRSLDGVLFNFEGRAVRSEEQKETRAGAAMIQTDSSQGRLIKASGPEIYLLKDGIRRYVPDGPTLARLHKEFGDVQTISDSRLKAYIRGKDLPSQCPCIVKNSRGERFLLVDGKRRPIFGEETLLILGGDPRAIPTVSDNELLRYEKGEALSEQIGLDALQSEPWLAKGVFPEIYLLRGIIKRWVTDQVSLHDLMIHHNLSGVQRVDETDLDDYIEGLPVGQPVVPLL